MTETMTILPPITSNPYNQKLQGFYGEFGAGSGVCALYLQSAIEPIQLERISMISEIEDSKRWPVRNLFQRDVDTERVTHGLLPYLSSNDRIKFFNPLTLTLLPIGRDAAVADLEIPNLEVETEERNGPPAITWEMRSHAPHYRVSWIRGNPQFAEMEWNDSRTRIVAIDGQHRLSALKRLWTDQDTAARKRLAEWRIPVVVVTFRRDHKRKHLPSLVDVVRNIFVDINTTAQEVSTARAILLSDESPSAVCTQELLQRSHGNDFLSLAQRKAERVPLLCYDWRGEESKKRREHAPAAVMGIEEVRDWFFHYLLGCRIESKNGDRNEFTTEVRNALGIVSTDRLHPAFVEGRLNHETSGLLRRRFEQDLLPAVEHVLQNFAPYRAYVKSLRDLEQTYCGPARPDIGRHAFGQLRFGSSRPEEAVQDQVRETLVDIKDRVANLRKEHLRAPVGLDIGMRGVMAAFGSLRASFGHPPWVEYAERFTQALNQLYNNGWLDTSRQNAYREHLRHLVEDHDEKIVNYRIDAVPDALGAYLGILAAAYGGKWPESWTKDWAAPRESLMDRLEATLVRGYRRQVRPGLREQYPKGGRDLTDAVNDEAQRLAGRHIRRFEQAVKRVRKSYQGV